MKTRVLNSVLLIFAFSTIMVISDANAHSLFNSAEKFIGGYRVQVATLPEFPQIDEKSQILFRVTDEDFQEVDRFTMGIRIFYNEEQVDAFRPESHEGSHWESDYVFERPGNHIFKVDLYDMQNTDGILTYTFNMSTQSPFGYIFITSIAVGSFIFAIVLGYIYIPNLIRKFRV